MAKQFLKHNKSKICIGIKINKSENIFDSFRAFMVSWAVNHMLFIKSGFSVYHLTTGKYEN